MKTTSNKDMLNAIRNQASEEYKERIPVVTSEGEEKLVKNIWDAFENYKTVKNEFIETLSNKIVRTDFFSKVYENPLKMLKKGMLPYGHTIEELFVRAAEAKGFFTDNYEQGGSSHQDNLYSAAELISPVMPKVDSLYISRNFAYVFKTSISDKQLKAAFFSQNGLSELVNQIVGSLTNGAEQQEYGDMKDLLVKAIAGFKKGMDINPGGKTGTTKDVPIQGQHGNFEGIKQYMYVEPIDLSVVDAEKGYKMLSTKIRELAATLKFPNTKYNMAGVKTWSNPEDLVFITTPEHMANMDVQVLSQAFNVSLADVNVRTILIDSFPKELMKPTTGGGARTVEQDRNTNKQQNATIYGVLMDKDFLQVIDTVNESRTFDNGRALTQNLFLHKQGILANCYFANAIVLAKAEKA